MCIPLAVALAIGAAAFGAVAQVQSANAQAKALNQQLAARDKEINHAASAEINDRLRAARRQQGRILVAAGQSGLSTTSGNVEGLLLDNAVQASLSDERSLANRNNALDAAAAEAQAKMPSKPTILGAGLQIGLAGAGAAVQEQQRKAALAAQTVH